MVTMWPFGKKAKLSEPKKERADEEKLKQPISAQAVFNTEAKELKIKTNEVESLKPIKLECPICKQSLDRHSRNRFKCPHCRNWIYFLGDNPVTREDHERLAEKYYQDRYKETLRGTMVEELAKIGLAEEKLKGREQELLAKMGVQPQKISVILSLFSETIVKVKDPNEKWERYLSLANILHKGGEDSFHVLQVAQKNKLAALKKEGYRNVSILAGRMCEACRKLDEKVLSIEEALKTTPIPIRDCQNRSEDEKCSFCNCEYLGKVDDEHLMKMK